MEHALYIAAVAALVVGLALFLRHWLSRPFVPPFSLSIAVQEREASAALGPPSHDNGLGYERTEFFYTDGSTRAIYRSLTPGVPDLIVVSQPIPRKSRSWQWWRRDRQAD